MNYFIKYNSPLQKRRVTKGYSQQEMSKHLGITQSQYSRIEKGQTNPAKHLKKLSEILDCHLSEVFQGEMQKKIKDDFLNDKTNSFKRMFHERKEGYVHLKIDGWFTKKQITENYNMLIRELNEWRINEGGIRWKHK